MQPSGHPDHHARVQALITVFQRIDGGMRDMPIYNEKVAVEAIGFRAFGEGELLGVLLTPWFMSMVMLPIEPVRMDMAAIGSSVCVELPAGRRAFVVGGDEAIGLYKAHSLHSPVLNFTLPGQAKAEARRQLSLLMTPPDVTAEAAANSSSTSRLDRRALLFGRSNAAAPASSGT
jgi:[NiFe] hydrogenase assembly HybE family chaperone